MTDFVHEPPKDPNKPPVPGEEKPTTERERMKKVYTYVAVLFAVSFLLILWTFLMNQRSSREVLDEIKSGNSALHDTLDENELLQTRVAELENEVSALEEQLAAAEVDRDAMRDSGDKQAALLTALDWLSELEHDYSAGSYSAARKTAQAMQDNGLAALLPEQPLHTSSTGSDYDAPAARYQDIANALFPNGMN